jgi:hypothetical protein
MEPCLLGPFTVDARAVAEIARKERERVAFETSQWVPALGRGVVPSVVLRGYARSRIWSMSCRV